MTNPYRILIIEDDATIAANLATADLLTEAQKAEIKSLSIVTQRALGYENFWISGAAGGAMDGGAKARAA